MKGSRVAKRYARALLELADKGVEQVWGAELERLAAMVNSPELAERLSSPEISEQSRQEAMRKIAQHLGLGVQLQSFAVVVARHGRIHDLSAIAESYRDLLDARLARTRATLTFAMQPSDEQIARVVSGLEAIANKTIIPTVKVDASLIGGVTAEMDGKIYDGSLANRLSEARRQLAG